MYYLGEMLLKQVKKKSNTKTPKQECSVRVGPLRDRKEGAGLALEAGAGYGGHWGRQVTRALHHYRVLTQSWLGSTLVSPAG